MAQFTPPTYDQPIGNRLGQYGIAFPVGLVVYIDGDDEVHETASITEDTIASGIKAGSGDLGLALFRRGLTYTVSAGEETILTNAGYTLT